VFTWQIDEVQSEVMAFVPALGLMLDFASREEGSLIGECDHQRDGLLEITTRKVMGNVDADAGLTHVAGVQHVEAVPSHDLDLDRRPASRDDAGIEASSSSACFLANA
jgi:hypothetical protein